MSSGESDRSVRAVVRGDQLHIHEPGIRAVHRPAPRGVERMLDGDLEDHVAVLGEEAVDAAIRALEADRVGRRAVLSNGALAATTGIFTLWLPGAAAAVSIGGNPTGLGYSTSVSFTGTDANGGAIGYFNPSLYSGSTFQVVAEGAGGAVASNALHEAGRGRGIVVDLDRAAIVSLLATFGSNAIEITDNSANGGTTVTGGGGNGGQAVAVVAGSNTMIVVAAGGGGAGLSSAGGDADADAPVFTNAAGGTLTGGSAGSGTTGGGAGGVVAGDGWSGTGTLGDAGLDSPGDGRPIRGGVDNNGQGVGGGGLAGGGSGGLAYEQPGGGANMRLSGGGGGSSFVNATYRVGTAVMGYSTRSLTDRVRVTIHVNE